MASVRLVDNIFEGKVASFTVSDDRTIESIIRESVPEDNYGGSMVECYDAETGMTFFAPVEDGPDGMSAIITVNGKEAQLDYTVQENDLVEIIITPGDKGWDWAGAIVGGVTGMLSGGMIGTMLCPGLGTLIGAGIGLAVGFVAGGLLGPYIRDLMTPDSSDGSSDSGLSGSSLPDTRGSQNQPLTDGAFPLVIGKHLATPFIIGSPYNEILGSHGEENYIHVLYAVGYAPLRITDIKLGDRFLAHNQTWGTDTKHSLENIWHGTLSQKRDGEIVNTWESNDFQIDILQQGQDGESIDWGSAYPYAEVQSDVKANCLYIRDEDVDAGGSVSYKGVSLGNGLRNNRVQFSEEFPKSVRVELDFGNGLYKTRSERDGDDQKTKYYRIPLWVAVQWRVYSEENEESDPENHGTESLPAWNANTESYATKKRGWHTFSSINGIGTSVYDANNRTLDAEAHSGQKVTAGDGFNDGWLNSRIFNLQSLGATNDDTDGLSEIRCVTEVDLVSWARGNLMASGDSEETFVKKFKSYFYDPSNTVKSIEVRVIRVSPNYINETVSTKDHSAFNFNDAFVWQTIKSTMLDGDKLINENVIEQKRPLSEADMRKLCVIAVRAKSDNTDQLSSSLRKLTCVAESFSPYYDKEAKRWFPENVGTYDRYYRVSDGKYAEITREIFEADRQNGIKSVRKPGGNDFVRNLVKDVIRTAAHRDSLGRYYIPDGDGTLRYCGNNVASVFLLAGIGGHLGIDAMGYRQDFFRQEGYAGAGDFNMKSLAEWYEWAECVKDGSTYPSKGYHYTHDGSYVQHEAGDEVEIYFSANAYIYKEETLEGLLAKITLAGRSVYTKDSKNRITVVTDKPEKYPVALINQQNTLKSSYSISFEQNPSGLQMTFSDENDGYVQNQVYCMADNESVKDPIGAIEQYNLSMVTNNQQLWSLGRYVLANRLMQKEVVTKTIGMEGASIGLGNLVMLQDDTMLIGTDTGGRITRLIEDAGHIYGFIINNVYEYTGETEAYSDSNGDELLRCVQGVVIMQPSQYKESRVITLRLGMSGTSRTVDGVQYKLAKGKTNLVLFDQVISKGRNTEDDGIVYAYNPAAGNMVGFGRMGNVSALYRVTRIKPDARHNYEIVLCKYQDDLYNYGAELPSFQNNMTIPDRSGEDAFSLSNNVTYAELVRAMTEAANLAQGKIDATFGGRIPAPSYLTASVSRDCIQFECSVTTSGANSIDHITYEILKPDGTTMSMDGSYSTEYYFDRTTDGYPERDELGLWLFRAKAISFYLDEYGRYIESEWTDFVPITEASLADYGTWTPPAPTSLSLVADEDGLNATWSCDLSRVYGTVQYEATFRYQNADIGKISATERGATYQFDRDTDGFPEKPGTPGISLDTRTLDGYTLEVRAVNITSYKHTDSEEIPCDWTRYKTWIPSRPVISARVSNRNVALHLSQLSDCYGTVQYLVGVRRYDDPEETFYVPDLSTNPYSRESAYKKLSEGTFVTGKRESADVYTQTMPLETQGGSRGMVDVDESEADDRVLVVSPDGSPNNRILSVGLGGFAPIDTSYQFEAYAFNRTAESYYDLAYGASHGYDVATYHKVSVDAERVTVTALATSVMDVLNGSIVSSKIAEGAITETKIEDDAISTPKLMTNAVQADKIYTYNMVTLQEGTHSISGFAPNPEVDGWFYDLVRRIKGMNKAADPRYATALDELDGRIRELSNNYWLGLDTEHPEFYMGNLPVSMKDTEEANYFHYYYDRENDEVNLDIKLSNFIVTAISSTIKGFFNVRTKRATWSGANSFLQVNPEARQDTSFGLGGEKVLVKGDVVVQAGNQADESGSTGNLTVEDRGTFGSLESLGNLVVGGKESEAYIEIDGRSITARSGQSDSDLLLNSKGTTVVQDFEVKGKAIGIYPIGACYMQFPNTEKPSVLFGGVWIKVTGLEGVFFRNEGGDAATFETGMQVQSIQSHSHSTPNHTHSVTGSIEGGSHTHEYYRTDSGVDYGGGSSLIHSVGSQSKKNTSGTGSHSHTFSLTAASGGASETGNTGDTETRPINVTVIIWQRIN